MIQKCNCFCIPKIPRVSCVTTYPYKQFQTLRDGPHIERNPYPGSIVCDAFPYFAPMTWVSTNNPLVLAVQAGPELTSNVWKAPRRTVGGVSYEDTLTITSKSPGGVVLERQFISHEIPGMPSLVTYTNNYDLDTNWRVDTSDPTNPANISSPYSITLNPFGSGIDPDYELVDRYAPFLDRGNIDKPTVSCTLTLTAQSGTTPFMGTRYTHFNGIFKMKVKLTGPHKRWWNFGSDIRTYTTDGSGADVQTFEWDITRTSTAEIVYAAQYPGVPGMWYSNNAVYFGYERYVDDNTYEYSQTMPTPPPGYQYWSGGYNRIDIAADIGIQTILDGMQGTKSLLLTGGGGFNNAGGAEGGGINIRGYVPVYTMDHTVDWPGSGPIDVIANADPASMAGLTRSTYAFKYLTAAPFPPYRPIDPRYTGPPYGPTESAEFKLTITEMSVEFAGPV